jgi:tetratricopeptide (TPR) repeat protein
MSHNLYRFVASMTLFLAAVSLAASGAESNPPPAPAARMEETNLQEILRASLQLQEAFHATQLALEQNHKEAKEITVQTAEALAGRLQLIEQTLASQRERELKTASKFNLTLLTLAGAFVLLGLPALLSLAYFQWRTVNSLSRLSAALPATRGLGPGPVLGAPETGEACLLTTGPAKPSNLRLLEAFEQFEKRLYELEHTPRPLAKSEALAAIAAAHGSTPSNGNGTTAVAPDDGAAAARISMLLERGQSMLTLGRPEQALGCFEEILALVPNHAEALVKKGAALERLHKPHQAVECYDRAIAADGSMTIAYLHKGGLFTRLERFTEAMECYQKALRTQAKSAG